MDDNERHRPCRRPADPAWYHDPSLLFVALPLAAWLALRLWGG